MQIYTSVRVALVAFWFATGTAAWSQSAASPVPVPGQHRHGKNPGEAGCTRSPANRSSGEDL